MKIFFVFIVVILPHFVVGIDRFIEKYTFAKAMSQCFGSHAYLRYRARIKEAQRACRGRRLGAINGDFVLKPMLSATAPPLIDSLELVSDDGPPSSSPGTRVAALKSDSQGLQGEEFKGSFVREMLFTATDEVMRLRQRQQQSPKLNIFSGVDLASATTKLRESIYDFACVLQRMEMIDEFFNVNYLTVLNTFIDNNEIDYRLADDLRDGINQCREAEKCLPEDGSVMPQDIRRLMKFIACERRTRLEACFRHDLRQNLHRYDLEALPNAKGKRTNYLVKVMAVVMGTDFLKGLDFV
ncbi:uncharacterized protein LOC135217162 [Macrobrachium nipponense]|uniref:uncharacterized protein LOC135217162 n=1 Tax=Macrobrachium nipponense TaxID=159736 RepID=UPI0030C84218